MFDTGVIYVYSDIPDVISFISPWVMVGRVCPRSLYTQQRTKLMEMGVTVKPSSRRTAQRKKKKNNLLDADITTHWVFFFKDKLWKMMMIILFKISFSKFFYDVKFKGKKTPRKVDHHHFCLKSFGRDSNCGCLFFT